MGIKYHYVPTRMAIRKKQTTRVGEDMEIRDPLSLCTALEVLQNTKYKLSQGSSIPLLHTWKCMANIINDGPKISTRDISKQIKCGKSIQWNIVWPQKESSNAIKQMSLENMVSLRSQAQMATCYMTPFTWNFQNRQTYRGRNWISNSQKWWKEENGIATEFKISFWDKEILEFDGSNVCII